MRAAIWRRVRAVLKSVSYGLLALPQEQKLLPVGVPEGEVLSNLHNAEEFEATLAYLVGSPLVKARHLDL